MFGLTEFAIKMTTFDSTFSPAANFKDGVSDLSTGLTFRPQELLSCQLCGTDELQRFVIPDCSVLWFCPACELYQHGKLVDASVYDQEYHVDYQRKQEQKLRTAHIRLNRISRVCNVAEPKLLDIGCSFGFTLQAARERGWHAMGVDVSHVAIDHCLKMGFECHEVGPVHLPFPDCTFDVVTSWHVIEHVSDVRETLAEWRRVLKPGGLLVMETPDATNSKVRRLGGDYSRFWVPEHTYTFSPDSLNAFVEQTEMEIVRPPMVGNTSSNSFSLASYAYAYRGYQVLRRSFGLQKAFQVFARRPTQEASEVSVPLFPNGSLHSGHELHRSSVAATKVNHDTDPTRS